MTLSSVSPDQLGSTSLTRTLRAIGPSIPSTSERQAQPPEHIDESVLGRGDHAQKGQKRAGCGENMNGKCANFRVGHALVVKKLHRQTHPVLTLRFPWKHAEPADSTAHTPVPALSRGVGGNMHRLSLAASKNHPRPQKHNNQLWMRRTSAPFHPISFAAADG